MVSRRTMRASAGRGDRRDTPLATGHQILCQIPTRVWLHERGMALGRPATLDDVTDTSLDRLAADGFDWVWLLGIWQTGELGRRIALAHPRWRHEYRALLPDFTDADVCGSPFAVQDYVVHRDFGGPAALARLRDRLARRGIKLMLDFVPNHTALDHAWVRAHPEFYVPGREDDAVREPEHYVRVDTARGPRVLAHGRDVSFAVSPDTLQLDHRHSGLREALLGVLDTIASQCDGVRCDGAMLVLPDAIARRWGGHATAADCTAAVDDSFWPKATAHVRQRRPDFVFMGEAHGDLERRLREEGFDYTDDTRLYECLRGQDAAAIQDHVRTDLERQHRSARFLEHHDEPRAAAVFPPPVHRAAAVLAFLLPGLRLVHEGQRSGRRARTSVHLRRRAPEPIDLALEAFYRRLLSCMRRPEWRVGTWRMLDCEPAWEGNPTWERFIAFAWSDAGRCLLVAVNYAPAPGQCYVRAPWIEHASGAVRLGDLMNPSIGYEREGDDLARRGLYLDLPAWGYHVFEVTAGST
jgi:hypothetical protein